MNPDPQIHVLVTALRVSLGLLIRRLRQTKSDGVLTLPEVSALARLEREGPSSSAALAKLEQISPQSMGATLAALESRGLIGREADPQDGRRVVLSLTATGMEILRNGRDARIEALARALSTSFTPEERSTLLAAAPLFERLAQTL